MNWESDIVFDRMRFSFSYVSIILVVLLLGCTNAAPGCFKGAGDLVRVELEVPEFTAITVFENIQLIISQGLEQQVVVESGSNLLSGISATVESGILVLRNTNSCNLFRKYGQTVIRVISPELESIRSSSGWPIRSEGVLEFSDLSLISESYSNPETETTDGAFELEVNSNKLKIVSNGLASFSLRGATTNLSITLAAGDSRVDASALRAGTVQINHRGSNDIEVFPLNRISGRIRGYGNVICHNRPEEIDVTEEFRGRLLFVDGL